MYDAVLNLNKMAELFLLLIFGILFMQGYHTFKAEVEVSCTQVMWCIQFKR